MLYTRTINGVELSFEDRGMVTSNPTIVCLPGLGQDHRGYQYILPFLVSKYRVIRILWRTRHGANSESTSKWSVEDQANDAIALLDSLQVQTFIPISHFQGGWCAIEMAARLGKKRVPAVLLTDFILTRPPAEFIKSLQIIQNKETWHQGQAALITKWLDTSNQNVLDHCENDLDTEGFENWAYFCWLVERNYERWGSPMERLGAIEDPPLVRHVFSHPREETYHTEHKEFAQKHPDWFSFAKLNGESHFSVIERPEAVSLQLSDLVRQVKSK